jgi:hypothetical protein
MRRNDGAYSHSLLGALKTNSENQWRLSAMDQKRTYIHCIAMSA